MQTSRHERREALRQSAALLAIMSVLALFFGWRARQPASADELRISIEELHAQSAELAALAHERDTNHLPARVMQAQLQQLGQNMLASYQDLVRLEPMPALARTQADAVHEGLALQRALAALRSGRRPNELPIVHDRLDALLHELPH